MQKQKKLIIKIFLFEKKDKITSEIDKLRSDLDNVRKENQSLQQKLK